MSSSGGFGRDSGTPRRRMLPAVTDVVRELARTVSADPAVLFKAARSVVADELGKVKQGFESAPLDVLVRRARKQLEAEGVAMPVAEPEAPAEAQSIAIPAPPLRAREKTETKPVASPDEPFQSAGASDLDWEKDLNIQPEDAPFRSAILPLPPRSRVSHGILPAERTAVPAAAPADPAPSAPPPSAPPAPPLPSPERVAAPEGLSVERSGSAPAPRPGVDDLPLFSSSSAPSPVLEPVLGPAPPPPPPAPLVEAPHPAEPPSPPFEPPASRVELPQAHVEPRVEPRVEPPVEPRVEPPVEPRVEPPVPRFDTPVPRVEPRVKSMPETPPLASLVGDETEPVEPEMGEFAFKAAEEPAPPPPKKGSRVGWLVAIAVVLAVAAGLVWAVRTFLSGDVVRVVEAPAPAPKKLAEPAPNPATASTAPAPAAAAPPPAPAAAKATSAPAKPAPAAKAAGAPAAAPVAKGKAALLLTPDWSGKSAVYVVHFSSHKDRPSAEKEARRLAGELGKPGRAVEVDIGPKGVWYRVVIGEFASVEDARAFRADLEAKKTPGLGFVYEMRGR